MTPRDFAYWLQGYFELVEAGACPINPDAEKVATCIDKHAALVLLTSPTDTFVISCRALARQPSALRSVVSAYFVHVIDPTLPSAEKDPAHPWLGNTEPTKLIMRC